MPSTNPTLLPAAAMSHRWSASRILAKVMAQVLAWDAMSRSRTALGRLDTRMLRDIGIDQSAAQEQVRRVFWRS